jgi:hypothetical protein
MKTILIGVSVALLALSSWLFYQLREANGSCNSIAVSHYTSQLQTARRLEEQLRDGRVVDALARLQDLRDANVVALSWIRSADPNWQFSPKAGVITRAEQAFRDEAVYRSTVGESTGRISEQATAVLAAYR